ncbi:MAG TPA: carboxypeptidase-like regulatory domain-containing protein, partial [Niastella sp.]
MKRLLMIITGLLFSVIVSAQKKTITGVVLHKANHTPLAGATVAANKKMVLTDTNGKFTLEASTGDLITVSFVGMKTVTLKLSGNMQDLSIDLEEGEKELEQFVVIGYQTQRKKDLT